jgi:single-strand DNA-binding protein
MSIYKNTITLKGFLGTDAVERTSSNQKLIVVLSLATKSSYRDKQAGAWISRTDWHRVVAFGRLAESAKSFTKGTYVEVEGQLQRREYVSGETKHRTSEVRARSITKLEHTPRSAAENLDAEPAQDGVPA